MSYQRTTWSISEEFAREHTRALRELARGLLLGATEVRSGISSPSADSLEEAAYEAEGLALAFVKAIQIDFDPEKTFEHLLETAERRCAKLLAALEQLDYATNDDPRGEIDGPDFDMAKQQARAVIAKARGDAS